MQVSNVNSQLRIDYPSLLMEFYKYDTFKSVTSGSDKKGYYVMINFIANDKNNSLRLYLVDITNQGGWTNDAVGAYTAVNDISGWAFVGGVNPVAKTPEIARLSGYYGGLPKVESVSFASVGTADAILIVDGSSSILKPGEIVSYSAENGNFFDSGMFVHDTATNAGSELLITYIQH